MIAILTTRDAAEGPRRTFSVTPGARRRLGDIARSCLLFFSRPGPSRGSLRFWFGTAAAMAVLLAPLRGDPVRVVSQTVGSDELLLALAEPHEIAALSHLARDPSFSAVSEEAKRYPAVDKQRDVESILKFRPTLVLFANYSRLELITQVQRAGIKVLVFDRYDTLEEAYENLRILGRELGAEEKAERVIADCQARVARLRERLRGRTPVRVIAPSIFGMIPGTESTFQDLCNYAAADNLAGSLGGLRGHQAPPNEQMLTWPVERVVVVGQDVASALAPFKNLPPYKFMPAVRDNRVALLEPYQISCVSHRRIDGYERLARELHPDAFP